jgi:hypothetical protein
MSVVLYVPAAGELIAQTWSASCKISMSIPHDEHLIIGRPLIRSMSRAASGPTGPVR